MEGSTMCPSMAQRMISEGKELVVQMDHKTMLKKVMEELGASKPPAYTVYTCANGAAMVSIKLDVSCTDYPNSYSSMCPKMNVANIDSEPCQSREMAEKNAVEKAFKHLSDKHLIKIEDFSSRVVYELDESSIFRHLNSSVYSVEKILEKWESVMTKCEHIAAELRNREEAGAFHGDGDTYGDLHQFMKMTIDMFKSRITRARTRAKEIEWQRSECVDRNTENYQAELRKGYVQEVQIPAKAILSYVLEYIGAGPPSYSNGPSSDGMIKGMVLFSVPDIQNVDICGNQTITGKHTKSREAEENAAFEALLYLEKKCRLKIADLNHADRIDAEKEQRILIQLVQETIDVADDVNVYWEKMVKSVQTEKTAYPLDDEDLMAEQCAARNKDDYRFCAKCLDELNKENTRLYEECVSRFADFQALQCKVNKLKEDIFFD